MGPKAGEEDRTSTLDLFLTSGQPSSGFLPSPSPRLAYLEFLAFTHHKSVPPGPLKGEAPSCILNPLSSEPTDVGLAQVQWLFWLLRGSCSSGWNGPNHKRACSIRSCFGNLRTKSGCCQRSVPQTSRPRRDPRPWYLKDRCLSRDPPAQALGCPFPMSRRQQGSVRTSGFHIPKAQPGKRHNQT